MESRRRLYKNASSVHTLTERIKKDRTRQINTRKNQFNANRNIDIDLDHSMTPTKPAEIKISQIKDKNEKLKAYIEQKRTRKLKETLEQKSPFLPYVPVGRWVEKKEPVRKPKAFTISTPIRNALMSDGKILKKSTMKEIAATASKKENSGISVNSKEAPIKSRKKILGEFNVVVEKQHGVKQMKSDDIVPINFNDSFEVILNDEDVNMGELETEFIDNNERLSNASVIIISESPAVEPIQKSPILEVKAKSPVQNLSPANEQQISTKENIKTKKSSRQKDIKKEESKKQTAKIVVPIKRPNRERAIEKKLVEKLQSKSEKKQKVNKKVKSVQQEVKKSPTPVIVQEEKTHNVDLKLPKLVQKPQSHTYRFYKASLDQEIAFISIQLKSFTSNLSSFVDKLPEETQSTVHQTIQQGNFIVSDKLKSFEDTLEKFENADPADSKRMTEDDIENYWMLLYEQIEKFKNDMDYIQEAKVFAMSKRRTRKTITETPSRRSRRIAESSGTPKHNSSDCFACTPLSASKLNTPRSAKKRRATFKKSIAFDLTSDH